MKLLKIIYAITDSIKKSKLRAKNQSIHEQIIDDRREIGKIAELIEQKIEKSKELPVRRDQHAKQHGCVWAEFIVEDDLPENIKVGIFQEPKIFPAWIRFSNSREQDDSKGDAQAMAIKLMGIEDSKALPKKDGKTQDFIMVNHPVFPIKDTKDYLERQSKQVTLGSSKCPMSALSNWIPFLFPSINPCQWRLREASIVAAMVWKKLFKKPASPLQVQYWSMSPYRLDVSTEPNPQAVKFFVKPSPENILGKPMPKSSNYLREAMTDYLGSRDAYFDFYIQLQTDSDKMPVEDPRIEWKGAPEYKVATIRIPAQKFDSPEQMEFGENLSYTPWHALVEHEPVGGINRVRKEVYQRVAKLRRDSNGVSNQQEPTEDTYQPHLLNVQLPHNALTVLVQIKPEAVENLRELLKDSGEAIKASFKQCSPSTHFSRWVILEDPDDTSGIPPHLLFTSNYDGRFEFYIRELVEVAKANSKIERIWETCKDYISGTSCHVEEYKRFLQRHSNDNKKPEVFYTAYRNRTVLTIQDSYKIREKIESFLDCQCVRLAVNKINHSLFLRSSSPSSPAKGIIPKIFQFALDKIFRVVEFSIGIRSQYRDPQQPILLREKLMSDGNRYQELRETEDRGPQNELTTFVAIKSNWCSKLLLKVILRRASRRAKQANGSLSGISTIHFLRWVILDLETIAGDKKSYLLFESNYDGSWDSYIDDFIKNARSSMNLVWGNCIGFPKGGCEDMESFKQHIRSHQFPAQIFYSAYPDRTVQNILTDLKIKDTVTELLQKSVIQSLLTGSSTLSI